jgi:hypothetical protein
MRTFSVLIFSDRSIITAAFATSTATHAIHAFAVLMKTPRAVPLFVLFFDGFIIVLARGFAPALELAVRIVLAFFLVVITAVDTLTGTHTLSILSSSSQYS